MFDFKKILIIIFSISNTLFFFRPALGQEEIIITPIINGIKSLSGKKFTYPRWRRAQIKVLRIYIPVGSKTALHTNNSPRLFYLAQGRLKHVEGEKTNYFFAGETFLESNKDKEHFIQNIGDSPVVLYVGIATALGLPDKIINWGTSSSW